MLHWAFISQLKKSFFFSNIKLQFSVYLLFHNIYQNDYFSGKIKQKPFSEVMQFFAFYLLCHNFKTTYL